MDFRFFRVFCGAGAGAEKEEAGRAAVGAKPGVVLIRSGDGGYTTIFLGNNREITIKYSGK